MKNTQIGLLLKRIAFTFFIILIYRIGSYIPLPYGSIVSENMLNFFGKFNILAGGAFSRSSIFSLSIMPYIVSSIINQMLFIGDSEPNGNDQSSKNKFRTRTLTMCLAFLQGFFLISSYGSSDGIFSFFVILNLISLVGGSMLLMWLGELITLHGIGNGISLIIFTGIVADIPSVLVKNIKALQMSTIAIDQFLLSLIVVFVLMVVIIFVELSARNISVNYVKQNYGSKSLSAKSYIPLKINSSGVIPPIFANAIMMFPIVVLGFFRNKYDFANLLAGYFSNGGVLYEAFYIILIVFFCFFYTFIVFDPDKAADNIKKGGGVVFGYRPGKETGMFLRSVVWRLTVVGAAYIVLICMSTELVKLSSLPPLIIGGTSLLIIVGVIVETISQIQVYLFSGQYNKILQKTGLRRRN